MKMGEERVAISLLTFVDFYSKLPPTMTSKDKYWVIFLLPSTPVLPVALILNSSQQLINSQERESFCQVRERNT